MVYSGSTSFSLMSMSSLFNSMFQLLPMMNLLHPVATLKVRPGSNPYGFPMRASFCTPVTDQHP